MAQRRLYTRARAHSIYERAIEGGEMIKRPKPSDTEEDLLSFQESFLASGGAPSAAVAGRSEAGAGEGRDVVRMEVAGGGGMAKPQLPSKRSKFKERQEKRTRAREAAGHPYKAMESQDTHITKVLSDIQERSSPFFPAVSMPTRPARHGFPTVHELVDVTATGQPLQIAGPSTAPTTSGWDGREVGRRGGASLFAQQFDSHSPEFFGIESEQLFLSPGSVTRDMVEPVAVMTVSKPGGREAHQRELESVGTQPVSVGASSADGLSESVVTHKDPSAREEFASEASRVWDRFVASQLISGEGLVKVGVAEDVAREEVMKIHQENVERLSGVSEQELLQERERVEQVLGPRLVAFLRARRRKEVEDPVGVPQQMAATGGERREGEQMNDSKGSSQDGPGWLHMNTVEREKMEWMMDVPIHPQSNEAMKEVRFSLEALVIPRGTTIPPHLGLHHHGLEPEAAGYTLSELLLLSRSSVVQQRVLSIRTLAAILRRSLQGEYAGLVQGSVVSSLLDAGLPLLLRYALDSTTDATIAATIHCIHALLVSVPVGYLCNEYSECYLGNKLPALNPTQSPSWTFRREKEGEEEEMEEEDIEIIQRDVIQGYLRMKLPHRLRYILEVCRPPLPVVTETLEILVTACRHSLQAASEVVHCPRLMNVIFQDFLPLTWDDDRDPSQAHGRPQAAAMKLVHAVCCAGRNLAVHLVAQHRLMDVVLRHAFLHPTEVNLPETEAYAVGVACLRVWRALLAYGLGCEAFRDTYPLVVRQLQQLGTVVPSSLTEREVRRVTALLAVVEAGIHIGGITKATLRMNGSGGELPAPAISWSHISGVFPALAHTLSVWTGEDAVGGEHWIWVSCLTGLLHCIASYYCKLHEKVSGSPLETLQQIESLTSSLTEHLPHSSIFQLSLEALRTTSELVSPPSSNTSLPAPPSLPSFPLSLPTLPKQALYGQPTMEWSDYERLLSPVRLSFISADLLLGYLRFCSSTVTIHKGIAGKVSTIFSHPKFCEYLDSVAQSRLAKVSVFGSGELYLLYTALKLFILEVEEVRGRHEGLVRLFHHLSFKLVSLLPPGMAYCVHDLLSGAVLHPVLLPELSGTLSRESLVTAEVGGLSLREAPLPSTSLPTSPHQPAITTSSLLTEAYQRLGDIRALFLSTVDGSVGGREGVSRSRALLLQYPLEVPSLLLPTGSGPLLPVDWPLLPIVMEYNKTTGSDPSLAEPDAKVVSVVTHTLYLLLLLENLRPEVLQGVSMAARVSRVMCVFLIGSELFLDRSIHGCLSSLLRLYCSTERQQMLNFSAPIPGLPSFHDLYVSLLSQFAAVSYGDQLFSCYILLPLQQKFPVQLRRCLWDEHQTILRLFSLPLTQVPVPIEGFLLPLETDTALLELYMKAIASGSLRLQWSPVFYLIALHHIHHFIFKDGEAPPSPLQRGLIQAVLQLKEEDIRGHVLLYAGPDMGTELGFQTSPHLTQSQRAKMLTFSPLLKI